MNEFDLTRRSCEPALGTARRPSGARLRRRRRGRARRRRGVGHVRRRIRGGRALPARDHVDARPRPQVPGGLAVRHRRDGLPGPGEAYIALGLPEHLGEREVLELADGAEALAQEHDVTICGGDLTRADELFVAVTVVGYADDADSIVTRRGAARRVTWSASPERSAARAPACSCWSESRPGSTCETGARLLSRHLRPRPLLDAGRALAAAGVSAMLDVSDGIASDLERLCEHSGVRIEAQLDGAAGRRGRRRGRGGGGRRPAGARGRRRARTTSCCSPLPRACGRQSSGRARKAGRR